MFEGLTGVWPLITMNAPAAAMTMTLLRIGVHIGGAKTPRVFK